jgi:hypothetical protein
MKSDPYQGGRWGGDMIFILSPSTYFDALVKQLKVQEYTFRSLYMINSAKRPKLFEFRVIYRPSDAISG